MNVFRKNYNYWIAVVLSFVVQIEWAFAAPPFATVEEEIDYHSLQSQEARSFFDGTMVNGMSLSGASNNAIQYKEYNAATGAWDTDADEQIMPPSAPGDTTIDDLKALSNNPGGINAATSDALAAGSNEGYAAVDEGINDSSHPNLWNDPFLDSSKAVLNDLSTSGLQTTCDSTTTTAETVSDVHFEDISSCLVFRQPPACSKKRIITNIETEGSCTTGAPSSSLTMNLRVDYATDFMRLRPICGGGTAGAAAFAMTHGGGRLADLNTTLNITIDPDMNTWQEVYNGVWQGKDCELGMCDLYNGTSKLSYRTLACVESAIPGNNWPCSIEWKFWVSRGDRTATRVQNFERLHQIFTVREDFVYEPAGCEQSNLCEILPDPEYTPSAAPGPLEATSTETWECTDGTNNRWFSGVKVDPTDPTLDGIFLPTRNDGPKTLFPGDDEEFVCYFARARNYQCTLLGPADPDSYLGTGYIERPDGTYTSSEFNVDIEEQARNGCDVLEDDTSCSYLGESPVVFDSVGQPLVIERTYDCGFTESISTQITNETTTDCGTGPIRCMGDECLESWDESNSSFGEAAAQTSVLGLASQDMNCVGDSPGDCKLFAGQEMECKYGGGGAVDCCNGGASQDMQAYVASFMIGYKANAELDITGTMAETANQLYQSTPIAEPINGAWGWVSDGAADLATSAGNSLGEMAKEMGMDFLTPTESKTMTFCATCTNLTADASLMLTKTVDSVAKWTVDTFGEGVAEYFFDDIAVDAAGEVTTSGMGGTVGAAVTVMMYAYMAYQITMLALSLLYKCDDEEFVYQQKVVGRSCTPQQKYCQEDGPTECWIDAKASCCFESPLARIVQEQAMIQGVRPDFGEPTEMDCSAMTVEQMAEIDWDEADLSEWIEILTVSGNLPSDADTADVFFGRDNISRATILSEADVERERESRAAKIQAIEDNLDTAQMYEASMASQVDDITADIAQMEADIDMLEAQVPPNEVLINVKKDELLVKDQQLTEANESLVNATSRVAYYQSGVDNGIGDIADLPNPSTINSRLDERIQPEPGVSLEKFRFDLRDAYWSAE